MKKPTIFSSVLRILRLNKDFKAEDMNSHLLTQQSENKKSQNEILNFVEQERNREFYRNEFDEVSQNTQKQLRKDFGNVSIIKLKNLGHFYEITFIIEEDCRLIAFYDMNSKLIGTTRAY